MTPSERLRRAAVQICDLDEQVRGTGFLIDSAPWRIITCEHVAAAAGVPRTAEADKELLVRFPQVKPAEVRTARVVGRLDPRQDDAVVLELDSPEPPVFPEDVLTLTPADGPDGHRFTSYGFRELGTYPGGLASGEILGAVTPPDDLDLLSDPLQLWSQQINYGMSGAPLFDRELNQVVGIISETFYPEEGVQLDWGTAWAIDGRVLQAFPEEVRPHSSVLPEITGPAIGGALAPRGAPSGWMLNGAPAPTHRFIDREAQLAWLTERWWDPACAVVFVVGPAGLGKTTLVRRWLDTLGPGDAPAAVFWWGFGAVPSIDEFFTAAFDYFSGGDAPQQLRVGTSRGLLLAAYLAAGRSLLVLDDIGALGPPDSAAAREVARLLAALTDQNETTCTCIVTARTPPTGIDARVLDFPPFDKHSTEQLLTDMGTVPASSIPDSVTLPLAVGLIGQNPSLVTNPFIGGQVDEVIGDQPKMHSDKLIQQLSLIARNQLSDEAAKLLRVVCLLRRPVPLTWTESLAHATEIALDARIPNPDATLQEVFAAGFLEIVDDDWRGGMSVYRVIRTMLAEDLGDRRGAVHLALSDMWWERRQRDESTGESERRPAQNLLELRPAIEAVHHMCAADRPDDAFVRLSVGVYRGRGFALVNQLGEWPTDLEILREFFAHGDILERAHCRGCRQGVDLAQRGWTRPAHGWTPTRGAGLLRAGLLSGWRRSGVSSSGRSGAAV